MEVFDWIVVGNGIAGKYFSFCLRNVDSSQTLLSIFDESLAPSCSLRSNATVALHGTVKGVSPLGDTIVDSYFAFKDFVSNYDPEGVERADHFIYPPDSDSKLDQFVRRYGQKDVVKEDCWLLDKEKLLGWFDKKK